MVSACRHLACNMYANSLNNDVFDTKHLGLNHLHNKAMIQYGSHARLHIFSKRNQGTLICYKIPLSRGNVDV